MKANELRVNNIVRSITHKSDVQVNLIDFHEIYSHLGPILLTEEWLLKFGFEWGKFASNTHSFLSLNMPIGGSAMPFFYSSDGTVVELLEAEYEHTIREIKYVHDLQNLWFTLVGEELEIK